MSFANFALLGAGLADVGSQAIATGSDPVAVNQVLNQVLESYDPLPTSSVADVAGPAVAFAGNILLPGAGTLAADLLDLPGPQASVNTALQLGGTDVFDDIFGGNLFEDFGLGDVLGTIKDVTQTIGQVQSIFGGGGGSNFPAVVPSGAMPTSFQSGLMTDTGDPVNGDVDFGGGGMVPTAVGGALAAGGLWLGTLLARTFGRSAASAVFTAANGVRVRINQLWPLVRRYGAQNVAGALGITVGALGTLLLQPGAQRGGSRRRAKGISARDVKTTRRTIGTLKKLVRMSGIRMGGGGGYRRSYYRPRRRRTYC